MFSNVGDVVVVSVDGDPVCVTDNFGRTYTMSGSHKTRGGDPFTMFYTTGKPLKIGDIVTASYKYHTASVELTRAMEVTDVGKAMLAGVLGPLT